MAQPKISGAWIRRVAITLLRKEIAYEQYQKKVNAYRNLHPDSPWPSTNTWGEEWMNWSGASAEYYTALGNRSYKTMAKIEHYMRQHREELERELGSLDCFLVVEL